MWGGEGDEQVTGPTCFSGDGDINDGKPCDERGGGQGLRME